MAKRTHKLYDAFPTLEVARQAASDLNHAAPHPQCPGGPKAKARKLRRPQDSGRLKYGVYVSTSCKIY